MRWVGGLLLAYVVVYVAHYIFGALYESGGIWSVLNVITAIGILLTLVLNVDHAYQNSGPSSQVTDQRRLSARLLAYANVGLSVWFFHNWIRLLMLNEGESVQIHHDVIWQFIAVLIVLVFTATGWRLWQGE